VITGLRLDDLERRLQACGYLETGPQDLVARGQCLERAAHFPLADLTRQIKAQHGAALAPLPVQMPGAFLLR